MKAFKKLMAAALVCVMALTMLTGCGVADKKSAKNMVEALNDAAKADKAVSYTYERTDAMDKIAQAAMKNAQNGKDIKKATVNGSYEIYTVKLSDTWNSVSDLRMRLRKLMLHLLLQILLLRAARFLLALRLTRSRKTTT